MSAKDILGSRKQTYGQAALADSASILPLIIATISSATSLIGAIGATVIAWRRENRESKRQEHDIEKIRLDIEKLRGELEKKEAAQRRKVKRLS
jgi:hypothetical protein